MTMHVDLVADIGESFGRWRLGDDDRLLNTLTSANIACGFHAGDPRTMEAAVRSCLDDGVAIGAHPSPDLAGFGRRDMDLTYDELRTDTLHQLGALNAIARSQEGKVRHLSPHGRLATTVATDHTCALAVLDAVEQFDPTLHLMTLTNELEREARSRGHAVSVSGMDDRAHEDEGSLVSRREPGAVIHDAAQLVDRALSVVIGRTIPSRSGKPAPIECQALLLHGDNLASVEAAEQIRQALEVEGVVVRSCAANLS